MKNGLRVAIDTNILYMFLYRAESKPGLIIKAATEEKIILVSTDSVKEELRRLLKTDFNQTDVEAENIISSLPIEWYNREIYLSFMEEAKIMPHKPDRPLVALALLLNFGILSANHTHFKHVKKVVKVWEIDELLNKVKSPE